MAEIIFALPYDPKFAWCEGWGLLLDAMRRQAASRPPYTEIRFDPKWGSELFPVDYSAPLLTMVQGINMIPLWPHLRSTSRNIGIAVPVEALELPRYILNAHRHFDRMISNSSWSGAMIRDAGFSDVTTIIHGADPRFSPAERDVVEEVIESFGTGGWMNSVFPTYPPFIIFSGGKLELRKSQDIVIQAVGHMMQSHPDVRFICDWFNPWPETAKSIQATALYRKHQGKSTAAIMRACGIDFARTRMLQTESSTVEEHVAEKLEAMRSCDVGIFPNRAEACCNSIMCETMACSKPVVALYAHGQADVLDRDDPCVCKSYEPLVISNGKYSTSEWFEPNLDEVIANLEWVYANRDRSRAIGAANADRLRPLTMDSVASQYLSVCGGDN